MNINLQSHCRHNSIKHLNGVLVIFVIDNRTYMVVVFFMVCFIDFICMVSFWHSTHLSPEFPVCLDNGWLPRPKSSSFSSTTSDRPITSQTCRVGARKKEEIALNTVCRLKAELWAKHVQNFMFQLQYKRWFSGTLTWLSSSLNEALPSGPAMMFPRSPACCNNNTVWVMAYTLTQRQQYRKHN